MDFKKICISKTLTIKEIETDSLEKAFPLINQMRGHLTLEKYIEFVKLMKPYGYKIVCLFENDEIVSYAGFAKQINLYYGHHIWVYDLITAEAKRGKGYGRILLSHIEQYAKDNMLSCVALSSSFKRKEAHRFYEEKMNYDKVSYVFKKDI